MTVRKPIVIVTGNHLSELPVGDSLMVHLDPDTTTLPELIEALIASGLMGEPVVTIPVNTSSPIVSGAVILGDDATTTNGTWTQSPTAYEYKWQEFLDSTWVDVSGETTNTYADMPVGEFRSAVRAENSAGWSDWAYSEAFLIIEEPVGDYVRWGSGSSNLQLFDSNKGMRNAVATSGVANCRANAPITEGSKIYQEVLLTWGSTNGGASFGLVGSGNIPTVNNAYWYLNTWNEANGAVHLASGDSIAVYANYGDGPNVVSDNFVWDLSGQPMPNSEIACLAIDATDFDLVKVWVKIFGRTTRVGADEWFGGGDPVTGTSPSFVLAFVPNLYFGGASDANASPSQLLDPDEFSGIAPDGYTLGQIVIP